MKPKILLIVGSLAVAAWMGASVALAQSPGTTKGKQETPGPGASQGGTQSERSGESGVPLPKSSPYSGAEGADRSKAGGSDATTTGMRGDANVKEVQQALKEKGHDPGPIDGVMGSRTKEALKSFQTANNIQATGTLNAETADKLGVKSGSSSSGQSSRGSSRTGDTGAKKSSD